MRRNPNRLLDLPRVEEATAGREELVNTLRLQRALAKHMSKVLEHVTKNGIEFNMWEREEIESAFEAGYRAGHADGVADAHRKETPPPVDAA